MAQNGVLFLDDLPEFKRTVPEVPRLPMEKRTTTISRTCFAIEYIDLNVGVVPVLFREPAMKAESERSAEIRA